MLLSTATSAHAYNLLNLKWPQTTLGAPVTTPAGFGDELAERGAPVLVLDGYERLGLLDDWVRDVLVPALPASSTTILVSRRPSNAAWRTDEWRSLLSELEIGPLTEADAAELVERRLGRADLVTTVLGFGRGHPLALCLAADALARRPDLEVHDGRPPAVVEELVAVFVEDLSADVRSLLEDVSLLRRVTLPTVTSVVEATGRPLTRDEAWRALRDLAFVTAGPAGLEIDAVVQDAIAAGVELRDPARARRVRQAAGRAALVEADRSPGWESTADLLHLVQDPVIRDAFSPPPGRQYVVDTPRSTDAAAVLELVSRFDGDEGRALLERWWLSLPGSFRTVRGESGDVQGVAVCAPFDAAAQLLQAADPVLADCLPDPQDPANLARSTLRWAARREPGHRDWLAHYRRLLTIRHAEIVPRLAGMTGDSASYAVAGARLTVAWKLGDGSRLQLAVTLGEAVVAPPSPGDGRTLFATHPAEGGMLPPWFVRWSIAGEGRT
jgi:hypothetical protein